MKRENLQTALNVLSAALWNQPAPSDQVSEEDYAFLEAQALFALPKDLLKDLNVPDELRDRWKQRIFRHYQAYLQSMRGLDELTKLLTAEGITPVVLKGASFAAYYRSPSLRLTGDVDVILHPNTEENYRKACALMESAGFTAEEHASIERHVSYVKYGTVFELHHYFSHRNDDAQLYLDEQIDRAAPVEREVDGVRFFSLPDSENGLVMLKHMELHFPSGLGFRHVMDWFIFADRIVDDAFLQNGFLREVRACGMETLMMALTRMGTLYFGLPEQSWCDFRDDQACAELFAYLAECGNFGTSKEWHALQTTTVLNSFVSFRSFQKHGLMHWEAAKRYPVLRPFAWLYQIIRYLRLGAAHPKPVVALKKNYKEHKEQMRLMHALDLHP